MSKTEKIKFGRSFIKAILGGFFIVMYNAYIWSRMPVAYPFEQGGYSFQDGGLSFIYGFGMVLLVEMVFWVIIMSKRNKNG